ETAAWTCSAEKTGTFIEPGRFTISGIDRSVPTDAAAKLPRPRGGTARGALDGLHGRDQLLHRRLCIVEQHHGLRVVEERIVDPGEPGRHRPLDHDGVLRVFAVGERG